MKKIVAWAGSLMLAFGLTNAMADTAALKIGVVDIQAIIEKAPQTQKFNDELKKQFEPRQKQLQEANKTLQEDQEKLNRDGSVMNASARKKLQSKIADEEKSLNKMAQTYQADLTAARNADMQKLFAQIQVAVNAVAKNNKFDLILEKQAAPFVNTTLDVTDEVIKNLS